MADDVALPSPDGIATAPELTRALQALRARSGLTIREVARASRTPVATTGDYFSGRHLPLDRDQFARILAACGETDQARIEQWQAALVRARRLPGRRTGTPYRGLERFEAEDARWFFGREDLTELLAYLAGAPSTLPLLLIGPSGAGKSSLLRAGLLPRLRADAAAALAADPASVDGQIVVCDLTVTAVPWLTARVAKLAAGDASGAGRATVIVDQFEAVFTLCADEGERRALIDGLCDLARTGLVVLALRADFYQQAIRYPGLLRAAQERHVVLGPMSAEQVRRAVVEPARLARTEVAPGLVELLLADLAPDTDDSGAHEPGALPMLSHALLAAWEHSRGGTLTVADYLAGGGIKDALTRSAERAYESLEPGQQRLARRLFLRLVHVADDLPPSRAAVPLDELLSGIGAGAADDVSEGGSEGGGSEGGADAEPVLAVFIDERMITVDTGTARLTHDALLAAWPRLRTWIEESAEELRIRRRISSGAQAWSETGREEAALWRGSQLAVAREWAEEPEKRAALLPLAGDFVAASVAAGTARERLERRRTTRLRSIVAVLTVLVVAVAGLTAYAFSQRQAATAAEAAAIKAKVDAITERDQADSRAVAFVADQLRAQDPSAAAQLSVAGYRIARTPQATASLLDATGTSAAARILDSAGPVQSVSLSPDRRLLVAAGNDGTLRLWNVAVPGRPALVATLARADKAHPLYTAVFSPDGRVIAAAGAEQVVQLWQVSGSDAGGAAPRVTPLGRPLTGPANTIYSIAFSRDGRLLAAGSADGTVRLWDVADPARPAPVGRALKVPGAAGAGGYVQSVAFSADGRTMAAGTSVKTVWLWNVSRPAAPVPFRTMPLTGPADLVSGVAFSPDGRTLAAASDDHKVWLWSVRANRRTAAPDGTLADATDWVNTVAFSPDGRSLAAGTSDASVLVWNLAAKAITATLDQPQPVTAVAWDGRNGIAAADADGTVALWSLPAPVLATGNSPASVAYSPNGATLAVGGTSVQLWDVATHTLLVTHALPPQVSVNATAFSPTGTAVAVALSNGTVALLSGRTLAPLGKPFTVISGRGTAESVAFSPNGALLVTGADDGSVRLFDVADPAQLRRVALVHDSGAAVYTVAFAPDGVTVAAASVDDLVRLWHVSGAGGTGSGGAGGGLTSDGPALGGLASYAIGLAFSPDSTVLAAGSADGTVRLWEVAAPARPVQIGAPLTGPSGYVWAAAFSPDGKTLAVGVTDGTVWLWNVAQPAHPALLATLTGPADDVYSVAFSPSGTQLAATSFEGTVHLWDTSPATARATICANLGQPLTRAEWSSYVPGLPYRAPCS